MGPAQRRVQRLRSPIPDLRKRPHPKPDLTKHDHCNRPQTASQLHLHGGSAQRHGIEYFEKIATGVGHFYYQGIGTWEGGEVRTR